MKNFAPNKVLSNLKSTGPKVSKVEETSINKACFIINRLTHYCFIVFF